MAPQILLVDPVPSDDDALSRRITEYAGSAHLGVRLIREVATVESELKESIRRGEEPVVVVVGPRVDKPLAVARRVHAIWPGHILFAPRSDALPSLSKEL